MTNEMAAQHLVAARRARKPGERLPENCRPETVDDALAIQRRVGELLNETVGGWKCSLPKADRHIVAPIFASTIYTQSPCEVLHDGPAVEIEPEIAFILGRDLPVREKSYTEEEVRNAIRETRLVLELMGCRYAETSSLTSLELLADSFKNQGLFLGPVLPDGLNRQLESFPVRIDGGSAYSLDREGKHPDGHPLRPLYWLANFLRGKELCAGQVITTGSYAGIIKVPVGVPLTITFGDLGKIHVTFS